MTNQSPAAPVDYYDLGVQHFLIGLHVPDRMDTSYPTQDRHTPAQETEFLRGWYDTKRAEEAKFADATELENWPL